MTIDDLRHSYGIMIVNTYKWGGIHKERGFRMPGTTTGAYLSQHKFGRAVDLVPVGEDVDTIRDAILNNPDLFPYITCIEMVVPWLHVDCRNWDKYELGIKKIYPRSTE